MSELEAKAEHLPKLDAAKITITKEENECNVLIMDEGDITKVIEADEKKISDKKKEHIENKMKELDDVMKSDISVESEQKQKSVDDFLYARDDKEITQLKEQVNKKKEKNTHTIKKVFNNNKIRRFNNKSLLNTSLKAYI